MKAYKRRVLALSKIEDINLTIRVLEKYVSRKEEVIMVTESGELGEQKTGEIDITKHNVMQNVGDLLGEEENKESLGISWSKPAGQKEIVSLEGYLSRPIQISTFQIAAATDVNVALSVWDLFTLDPTVRAKLRNYAFLRGNLHVRIAMSGTPFHYGRLLVSYQPQPERNDTLQYSLGNVAVDAGYRPMLLTYLSQAPGAVTMDVKDNQPTEIVCPYICAKPMYRLWNGSASISAATSYVDLAEAGDLYIYSLNQMASVSAGLPSDISVYVYAWMTEVELGTLTATQVEITTESGDMYDDEDERKVGYVEQFATKASQFAGSLVNIPVIRPYAMASEMMFSALGGVASIFGWSKPIMQIEPSLVKNVGFQNGAHIIGYDTNYKLTLDPKQELTVSGHALGVEKDELVIADIAARESYLTTFAWNDDSVVMSDKLWVCGVSPQLYGYWANVTTRFYQPTAMAFAAEPFQYWRGDIKFRLDVVCSAYHRGKFAVIYEPNVQQKTLIMGNPKLNKQYLQIIDIQETQSIEFCVKWATWREWLMAAPPDSAARFFYTGPNTTEAVTTFQDNLNGFIYIVPITTLQSPDDSDISINVFVSCENLNVNYLTDVNLPNQRLYTESGDAYHSPILDKGVTCLELNKSSASDEHIGMDYFGERPISFRSLLKRYVYSNSVTAIADANLQKTVWGRFPIIGQIQAAYSNVGTTYDRPLNLFSYLRYAFVGVRGGVRKRLHFYGPDFDNPHNQVRVKMQPISVWGGPSTGYTYVFEGADLNGTVVFVPHSNGGIEVECPYYANNLFQYSFASNLVGSNSNGEVEDKWASMYETWMDITGSSPSFTIVEETAAAEDFTFLRFQGAPYHTLVP
jgi:hypothetical protein